MGSLAKRCTLISALNRPVLPGNSSCLQVLKPRRYRLQPSALCWVSLFLPTCSSVVARAAAVRQPSRCCRSLRRRLAPRQPYLPGTPVSQEVSSRDHWKESWEQQRPKTPAPSCSIPHSEATRSPQPEHLARDAQRAQHLTMLRRTNGESGFWRAGLERGGAAKSEPGCGDLLWKPPGKQMGVKLCWQHRMV